MSASSYAVGNRVYRGGSSAPTMGTVDPMGYIERELNKMASQTRSGLAAAALRRAGTGTANPESTAQDPSVGAYGIQSQTATSGQLKTAGGGASGLPPLLKVSQIGKLQAPDIQGVTDGFSPSFDANEEDAKLNLGIAKKKFDSDYGQSQFDLERDYGLKKRSVAQEQPVNQRRLLEDYGGRGLAYSSGYTYDRGDLDSQYAQMLSDLDQSRGDSLQDLLRQQGLFNDEYAGKLGAVEAAAKRRAADELAAAIKAEKDKTDAKNAEIEAANAAEQAARAPIVQQYQDLAKQQGDTYIHPQGYVGVTPDGNEVRRLGVLNSQQANTTGSTQRTFVQPSAPPPNAPAPQPLPQYNPAPAPAPAPAPQQQLAAPRWEGKIDDRSRSTLAAGGQVTRGNGYVYQMSGPNGTGVPIRVR